MAQKHGVRMYIVMMALACLCPASSAGHRTAEETLAAIALPLPDYLGDLRNNYTRIDALLLKRGAVTPENARNALRTRLLYAQNPVDKALCNYLLARSYYWQGFHEFKMYRDASVFKPLYSQLFAQYVEAFVAVNSAEGQTDESVRAVKQCIVRELFHCLSTNVWGGKLTEDEKNVISVKFLAALEDNPTAVKILPPRPIVQAAYRHVGRPLFSTVVLPSELPRDIHCLSKLLTDFEGQLQPSDLLPAVEAMEKMLDEVTAANAAYAEQVALVYNGVGEHKRSFDWLLRAAPFRNQIYLTLYVLSAKYPKETQTEVEDRQEFFKRYLEGAGVDGAYTCGEAYLNGITQMTRMEHYSEALSLIGEAERSGAVEEAMSITAQIAARKAYCLHRTGRREEAIDAYLKVLLLTKDQPDLSHVRRVSESRLAEIIDKLSADKK